MQRYEAMKLHSGAARVNNHIILDPTFIIRREGHRIALTSQVRPRPAHDLCRDRPKWPLAPGWAAENGGRRGDRSGTMAPHADAGAAAKQAPSERANSPALCAQARPLVALRTLASREGATYQVPLCPR